MKGDSMKRNRWFSLWKLQGKYTTKPLLFLLLILAIIQGGFFGYHLYQMNASFRQSMDITKNMNQTTYYLNTTMYRFEELLEKSHIELTFLIALWVLVLMMGYVSQRQSANPDSEIMYIRLPLPQKHILNFRIIHNITYLFLFYAAQFFLICLWNLLYQLFLPSKLQMTNAMYLSMLRWDFLYNVYPFYDGLRLLANGCLLLALAVTLTYNQFMKSYARLFPQLFVLFYTIVTISTNDMIWLIIRCIICIALVVWEYVCMYRDLVKEGLVTKG